jgi:NodT family efflux transporter outer membrane factor (OMF) lipoprotein
MKQSYLQPMFTIYWQKKYISLLAILLLAISCQPGESAYAVKAKKPDVGLSAVQIKTGTQWEEIRTPLNAQAPGNLSTSFPDLDWWRSFQDPYLTNYIQAALTNNPDVHIAVARIAEARASFHNSISQQIPTANLSSSFYHVALPKVLGSSLPKSFNIWTIPFQASYEVDLFGKKLDQTRATQRLLEASQLDARTTQISLCGEVAGTYFNLLRSDALTASQQQNLALLSRVYELKQSQYKMGLVAYDEVIRADRDVAQAQTNLSTYQQQQALFAHQLAILTGSPPTAQEKISRGTMETVILPTQISTGTPAEVLARRPDIQAAEKRLESLHFSVRAARKAFLPTLNLSGGLFLAGADFSQLFNWSNRASLLSGSVTQPLSRIYEYTTLLNIQKARQKQQMEEYRKVTLNALKEVEDNLALIQTDFQSMGSNEKRRDLTQHELGLNQNLYQQGLIPHLNVLQSQSELIQYQQLVAQSKMDTAIATVNLYKALGGGY